MIRTDTAGATPETADHCHRCDRRFSFGYELTEPVRAAILHTSENHWIRALDQAGSERQNGQVVEITPRLDQPLTDRLAGHRSAGAPAPRRATVVHRPRWVPLPSDLDRPD